MHIRPAEKKDYEELMTLYNDFVGEDRYSHHNNDAFFYILQSRTSYIYVALEKGHIIGFASFSVRNVVRYNKPIAELEELFVKPEARKKGVGRKLLDRVLNKATKLNCYRMYISSHVERKIAHKFYKSLGFVNYGYHFKKNLL